MVTATKVSTPDTEIRYALDSEKLLSECCDQNIECRCQFVHSGDSMQAIFVGLDERGVELKIPLEEACKSLHPKSICCVSFPYRTSFCAFVGCLLDVYQQESGERRLVATFPGEVTVTNLRQAFRVPVLPDAGLEAIVRLPDKRAFNVAAQDIAEGGMEVEFARDDKHGLMVGMHVAVQLKFRDKTVVRKAEVRRVVAPRCGLYFGSPSDNDGRRQAAAMHAIMLSMQQLWLKNRLK